MWQKIIDFLKNLFTQMLTAPPALPTQPQGYPEKTMSPWMSIAISYIGESMVTGAPATAFDKMCFQYVDDDALDDGLEKSGCAAFGCMIFEKSGYPTPRTANALKMGTRFGTPCDLKYGAGLLFTWDDGSHHWSHYAGTNSDGTIRALGGNQGGSVKYSNYDKKYITAIKWPVR